MIKVFNESNLDVLIQKFINDTKGKILWLIIGGAVAAALVKILP